jgi:hypothetical protein
VGFNANDSYKGKELAHMPDDMWDIKIASAAWNILKKYKKTQLFQFDLGEAPKVCFAVPDKDLGYVRIAHYPLNPDLLAALRLVPGRKYEPAGTRETLDLPYWRVPVRDFAKFKAFADKWGIELPQHTLNHLQKGSFVDAPVVESEPARVVKITSKNPLIVRLYFPYSEDEKNALKTAFVQKVHYSPKTVGTHADKAHWVLSIGGPNAKAAKAWLLKYDYAGKDEVIETIDSMEEREAKARAASKSMETSNKSFQVEGMSPLYTLYEYQASGMEYMVTGGSDHEKEVIACILADDMGLGKTLQSLLTSYRKLLEAKRANPEKRYSVVCVVPASTKFQWYEAVRTFIPSATVKAISGKKTLPDGSYDADFVVINYDVLLYAKHTYLWDTAKVAVTGMIIDEATYIKNLTSGRTQNVLSLSATHADTLTCRLALSGTIVLNRPAEMIGPLVFCGFIKSQKYPQGAKITPLWTKSKFETYFCAGHMNYAGIWDISGASNLKELHYTLTSKGAYLRRLRDDVAKELPPIQRTFVPVELSNDAEYRKAATEFRKWYMQEKGRTAPAADHLVKLGALLVLAERGKIEPCLEQARLLLDAGHKMIIFAYYKETQQAVYEALAEYKPVWFAGGMSESNRKLAADTFNFDTSCRVCVASTMAACMGVNLQGGPKEGTNVIMVLRRAWNRSTEEQIEGRARRLGNVLANDPGSKIQSIYLEGIDSIDQWMHALIDEKQLVASQVIEGEEVIIESDTWRRSLDEFVLSISEGKRKKKAA